MAEMGRYCKAYHVRQLREFPGWDPNLQALRAGTRVIDGEQATEARATLDDDDVLYLQENLSVTDGIFLDENVVFTSRTRDWEEFCRDTLGFAVPADVVAGADEAVPAESAA